MPYLIYDILIAAVLLFTAWRGYKKGFILTLFGFSAVFVAMIGATLVSNMLAAPIAKAIQPAVSHSIHEVLSEAIKHTEFLSVDGGVAQVPEDLPLNAVIDQLKESQLFRGFAGAFQKAVDDGLVAATANASRILADYIARQIARMVLYSVSFGLILIAWFFLSHALDLAFHLPVLSSLNRGLGGLLGLLKASLLVFAACWLLKGSFLPQEAIQNTTLLRFFCNVSPLAFLP